MEGTQCVKSESWQPQLLMASMNNGGLLTTDGPRRAIGDSGVSEASRSGGCYWPVFLICLKPNYYGQEMGRTFKVIQA